MFKGSRALVRKYYEANPNKRPSGNIYTSDNAYSLAKISITEIQFRLLMQENFATKMMLFAKDLQIFDCRLNSKLLKTQRNIFCNTKE
jgi:hypothetical protein